MTTGKTTREILADLVSFDTTSRNSNLALLEYVGVWLGQHGHTFKLIHDETGTKANLFATIGPEIDGGIVLSGHTDVVPVDDQDWTSDPFTLTEKGTRLFGRGTCDMKGFIAIVLAHIPIWSQLTLKTPLHLAFSYDEEVGCLGVGSMIEHIKAHIPKPRAVIVGEPTDMKVINAHKSIRSFTTTVTGLEAHSSQQQIGVSAIIYASRLISFLDQLHIEMKEAGDPSGRFTPPWSTIQIGTVAGGTAVNIIPHHCRLQWEYRSLPTQDNDVIIDKFNAFAEELKAEMKSVSPLCDIVTTPRSNAPGLAVEEGCPAEELVLALARQNHTEAVSYATEAGLFQQAEIPTVVCGPGNIEQAHKPDEFIEISQIEACEAFMKRLTDHVS